MDSVKTGDILIFSSNTATGFLLRTFTSSLHNHAAIAVRLQDDALGNKRVSLNECGKLYFLEINTGERMDAVTGKALVGVGFSDADWATERYNIISVRRLKSRFRTPKLAELTLQFAEKYRGWVFTQTVTPFLAVWLGISLNTEGESPREMFCSELCAYYYKECVAGQDRKLIDMSKNDDLSQLFGVGSPDTAALYTPEHFTHEMTPHSSVLEGREEVVHQSPADLGVTIIQPLILILVVCVLIRLTLPDK
jgi:hypothetical protein